MKRNIILNNPVNSLLKISLFFIFILSYCWINPYQVKPGNYVLRSKNASEVFANKQLFPKIPSLYQDYQAKLLITMSTPSQIIKDSKLSETQTEKATYTPYQFHIPSEVKIILLLGMDTNYPTVGRTDALILVFVNPILAKASLLSIPRDLLVNIPGYGMECINLAYPIGGINLLLSTFEYNFNFIPDDYFILYLDIFANFIDSLGGVDIYNPNAVVDPWCNIPAGNYRLSGYDALCYVRSRMNSSDFDRNRRQQEIVETLLKTIVKPKNIINLPYWFNIYRKNIETSITGIDVLHYIPLLVQISNQNKIASSRIGIDDVTMMETPAGAYILIPDQEAIKARLENAIAFVLRP